MAVYAETEKSKARYITPGKKYLVDQDMFGGFDIIDDEGDEITCTWRNCPHTRADWTRVEINEEEKENN